MNEPIPISRDEPLLSTSDQIALDRARDARRIGWVIIGLVGLVVLAFVVPLSVLLIRLALGG